MASATRRESIPPRGSSTRPGWIVLATSTFSSTLFYDYRTNVGLYPQFQEFFRQRKPPTLIVWGRNDQIFPAKGAHPYRRDLPDAELHLLDTGHYALEDKGAEIARLMLDFLERKLPHRAGQAPVGS